jgi:hypothetical protein
MEGVMKTEDLIKVWDAPDNSKLTPKQMSIRLPLHVAASISALAEMFPKKTKTEIIGDLLATSIDQAVQALPGADDSYELQLKNDPANIPPNEYERFNKLKKKYLEELEKEIAQSKEK